MRIDIRARSTFFIITWYLDHAKKYNPLKNQNEFLAGWQELFLENFDIKRSFIAIMVFLIVQGCSPLGDPVNHKLSDSFYFNKSGDGIIYCPMGNWFELGDINMESADVATFEVLGLYVARDKYHAYYRSNEIDYQVDLETFRVKDGDFMDHYPVDKDHVYAFDREGQVMIIDGADPNQFQLIDASWAKDGRRYFYNNQMVEADYGSFEVLNDHFCKDKDRLYTYSYDAGVRSFKQNQRDIRKLDDTRIHDGENIYWYTWYVRRVLVDSVWIIPARKDIKIDLLDGSHLKVGDKIYAEGALVDADANSFQLLDYFYARDSAKAFWWGQEIDDSHGASFEVLSGSYARDKNHVYYEGRLVEKADPATFHRVDGWYYYADDKYKFDEGEILKDEDI